MTDQPVSQPCLWWDSTTFRACTDTRANGKIRLSINDWSKHGRKVSRIVTAIAIHENNKLGSQVFCSGKSLQTCASITALRFTNNNCIRGSRDGSGSISTSVIDNNNPLCKGGWDLRKQLPQ